MSMSMKSRCGFLRDDITQRARESFPDQFQIISDPENYKFYSKVIEDDVPRQLEILHVGIYDQHIKNSGRRALYAFADAQEVSYFHGRKGERTFPLVDELFPDAGCIRFKDGQGPFQFLRSQNRTNQSAEKTEIRKSLRTGLDTLVKFAFLYAGRRSLTADHRDEFLVQLERVCRLLVQSQTDCKEKLRNRGMVPKRVDLDNDSEASEGSQLSSTIPSLLGKRGPIKGFGSNAGLNFGRTAVEADLTYGIPTSLRGTIGTTVPPPQAAKGIARKVIPNGHKRANPVMEEMSNEHGRGREPNKRSRDVEFPSPNSKRTKTNGTQEFERLVEPLRQNWNRLAKLEAKNEELEVRLAESEAEAQALKKEITELQIKHEPLKD